MKNRENSNDRNFTTGVATMIGTTISHHKILEKPGEGGMGIVYKVQGTKFQNRPRMFYMSGCDFDPALRDDVVERDLKKI